MSDPAAGAEPVDRQVAFRGRVITAGTARYRHADGQVVQRDAVWHPGAVGIVAVDDAHVWLTRQPREVAGLAASLEIPAGKLDVPGEPPEVAARRELAEEVGKAAGAWRQIAVFHSSPGFTDERVTLYLAQDLTDMAPPSPAEEDERITIVPWPLSDLDGAIVAADDAKTGIALLWLARARLRGEL